MREDIPSNHAQHVYEALTGSMDEHGAWVCPACYPDSASLD